jgi:phosphatidylglycerol:prolipoprotein diacylglycerol transferase
MRQVLFRIPIPYFLPDGLPIYGFGAMLLVAFIASTFVACRRARREGIAPELVQDVAMWILFGGLVGARILFMIQYHQQFTHPLRQFFFIWEGGLIFYGSVLGGVVGYLLAYWFILRKHRISSWKLADIYAPSVALGLCLGRIGCFLNGCCYGNVACPDCPKVSFPLSAMPRFELTSKGYQAAAGFTMLDPPKANAASFDERTVGAVDPHSPAAESGLQPGDVIIKADGHPISSYQELVDYLYWDWPRGKTDLALSVQRGNEVVKLPSFQPRSLGLHPTQLYESVSTLLLFLLLTAYFPFRRREGEVMILFMLGYSVHRFLNEMLRNDTDPVAFGMTLSQNGSILVYAAALVLAYWLWRSPQRLAPPHLAKA